MTNIKDIFQKLNNLETRAQRLEKEVQLKNVKETCIKNYMDELERQIHELRKQVNRGAKQEARKLRSIKQF